MIYLKNLFFYINMSEYLFLKNINEISNINKFDDTINK